MAYLEEPQYTRLKKFASKNRITMSRLLREALEMRIDVNNPYIDGFNHGIKTAMDVVSHNKAGDMRFPSGKSFAELIHEDLEKVQLQKAE